MKGQVQGVSMNPHFENRALVPPSKNVPPYQKVGKSQVIDFNSSVPPVPPVPPFLSLACVRAGARVRAQVRARARARASFI